MLRTIKNYYFIQLAIAFILALILFIVYFFIFNDIKVEFSRILWVSIIGVLTYTVLNGIIHLLNFTFHKRKNVYMAFYLPAIIWFIPLAIAISEQIENGVSQIENWFLIILLAQPMFYNIINSRKINLDAQ